MRTGDMRSGGREEKKLPTFLFSFSCVYFSLLLLTCLCLCGEF
jgi:hypothetical protein